MVEREDIMKEKVRKMVEERLVSMGYTDVSVTTRSIVKNNNLVLNALLIMESADQKVVPNIYIDDILRKGDVSDSDIDRLIKSYESSKRYIPSIPLLDVSTVKNNIVFQLINTEQNKEKLQDMPHREFHDLSIIYRWVVEMDEQGIQSTVIHNNLAQNLGLSEEQLFKCAAENTRRILQPTVRSMYDVLREIFTKDGMAPEIADMMLDQIPDDNMMWIISNEKGINGAASILYEDNLHWLAEKLDSDLYILPSSVHECIAVSADMGDPYELAKMVSEINMGKVSLDERLSNQIYLYDRSLRRVSLATDTPNKRLDGTLS